MIEQQYSAVLDNKNKKFSCHATAATKKKEHATYEEAPRLKDPPPIDRRTSAEEMQQVDAVVNTKLCCTFVDAIRRCR